MVRGGKALQASHGTRSKGKNERSSPANPRVFRTYFALNFNKLERRKSVQAGTLSWVQVFERANFAAGKVGIRGDEIQPPPPSLPLPPLLHYCLYYHHNTHGHHLYHLHKHLYFYFYQHRNLFAGATTIHTTTTITHNNVNKNNMISVNNMWTLLGGGG